jgi:hypothetical protein
VCVLAQVCMDDVSVWVWQLYIRYNVFAAFALIVKIQCNNHDETYIMFMVP